ncbi:uncharacterized protein LOC135483104 isoform X2 [Lineus longissimus]|uniref:uncharacterized protein LOC135483104 isoform X2 n=1 Tax=Lineus longissimus TaxID=88925 RepID=UPI00315CCF70
MDEETVDGMTVQHGEGEHVLCWGCSEFGQHGHSKRENIPGQDSWLKTFSGPWDKRAKYFSCGSSHTVVVTNNNTIYAWGNGHCGQVGCGDMDSHDEPICIKLYANQQRPPEIKGIACGWRHTFILLENGNMFSYGNNQYAQLGYDPRIKEFRENQPRPHLLRTFTHLVVDQVACGEKHSLFLIQDGTVGAVGNNCYGQLGIGDCAEATIMQKIESLSEVKAIACGANHSLAVGNDGGLHCWGFGKACGSKDDNYLFPERKYVGSCRFTAVSGGSFHSVALSVSKNVFSWGSNSDGQLGHGEKVRFVSTPCKVQNEQLMGNVAFIACGDLYTSAITDGSLYMWGKSSYVIDDGRQPAEKVWQPLAVNVGGYPVKKMACGSWHVVAVTGKPDLVEGTTNGTSEAVGIYVEEDSSDEESSDDSDSDKEPTRPGLGDRQPTIPIGEFYAPTPEPKRNGIIPSPDLQTPRGLDLQTERGAYDPRTASNVSSQYQTARPDSTDPDYGSIAVYINEVHENGAHTSTTDNNWTLNNLQNCRRNTASARSFKFSDDESSFGREKQEVRLSNGEVLPRLETRLEQTNSDKLLKDNSLPGRQALKASPYGLYRSKTLNLNPVVTRKSLDNLQLERERTTVTNKNIGFVTPEDLRPLPRSLQCNDLWQPFEDGANHMVYRMRPNRVRKNKTTAEKKADVLGRNISDGDMSSTLPKHNSLHSVPAAETLRSNGTSRIFPKPQFPPSTVFTHVRSKTFIGSADKPAPFASPPNGLKMLPRQHTSMVDLRLFAEGMNISNVTPLRPIVKESRKLRPPATSPSLLMTKRNKTLLLVDHNRNYKSNELPKPQVRPSPVLSAPAKRPDRNESHEMINSVPSTTIWYTK